MILDGKIVPTDRFQEKTVSVRSVAGPMKISRTHYPGGGETVGTMHYYRTRFRETDLRLTGREVRSMCEGEGSPASVSQALAMLHHALDHLNAADVASLPSGVQAEALRALGRAEAKHTAARARVLAAFAAQGGFEDDGHGAARTWLKWQTRVTTGPPQGPSGGREGWPRTR